MSEYLQNRLETAKDAFETHLKNCLNASKPQILWEAMAYSVLGGGKRIRPLLCLFACEAVSGSWQAALPAACAVELIHTYSLIHDDLPALDNDDWRRGRPSNHCKYGEDIAILAGDALLTLAFQHLAERCDVEPAIQVAVMAELARAAGPSGMCAGQVLDVQGAEMVATVAEVLEVYRLKTGALIRAAVRMGGLLGQASATALQGLTTFAEQLGQAFQIVDDLLDLTGSLDSLGKTPGKDQVQDKRTYPALVGMPASEKQAQACLQDALSALEQAGLSHHAELKYLAHLLVERKA